MGRDWRLKVEAAGRRCTAVAARTLEGQVALVTGAGRGIGRAIALVFAEAGSAVVLGARSVDEVDAVAEEVTAQGGRALAVPLDVTDLESMRGFVAAAMARFGQIDVLVNNAGSNNGGTDGAIGPLWEVNPAAWWHDVEVNYRGTFHGCHAALRHMVARGRGRIVNISSVSAAVAWPYGSAYASSKAAQIRLTDSLAAELRGLGISVFAISPGRVHTRLTEGAIGGPAGQKWIMPNVKTMHYTPITAEVPARQVLFLVSGEADGLTGRFLQASWDLRDLASRADDIAERDVLQLRLAPAGDEDPRQERKA
jgi:NAD(P)-dependent dehydrogenase (short-subunit alcohol dehydrogenase family)